MLTFLLVAILLTLWSLSPKYSLHYSEHPAPSGDQNSKLDLAVPACSEHTATRITSVTSPVTPTGSLFVFLPPVRGLYSPGHLAAREAFSSLLSHPYF